jgi:zinc protease
VIISELQGGENDPEQLLDTEVTATAFKVHPYHHPTIGWLSDLQSMTRDDLYGHYRRYYVPSNATLVIVGDVDTDDVLARVAKRFGGIAPGSRPAKIRQVEPEQQAERRVVLRRPGTTAYWKAVFHAPPFEQDDFFPLLVADAVLNGAAGLNIWSMGGVSRPQRSARLYRALVDKGLASSISGALMPTDHPYLYSINASVAEGQSVAAVEEAVLGEIEKLRTNGITPAELTKVHAQLKARFIYDADSVTDIAHQLGFFETVSSWRAYEGLRERLSAVTPESVHAAAQKYLTASNRTIGWFEPIAG